MKNENIRLPEEFTVTAHTGCMNSPANTVESMTAGLNSGADIIEIDVRFISDGTPVLAHNPVPAEKEASCVRLSRAFECMKQYPDKKANLDIKMTSNMPEIQRLAKEAGIINQIFFTGVNRKFVRAVKNGCPDIPYYLNIVTKGILKNSKLYAKHLVKQVKKYSAIGINTNKESASDVLVREFHRHGLLVSFWTISDKTQAEKYIKTAPDNITTKNPPVIITLAQKLK